MESQREVHFPMTDSGSLLPAGTEPLDKAQSGDGGHEDKSGLSKAPAQCPGFYYSPRCGVLQYSLAAALDHKSTRARTGQNSSVTFFDTRQTF